MGALELGFGIVLLVFAVGIIALVLLQEGQQQNENRVGGGSSSDTFLSKNKGRTIDAFLSRWTTIIALGLFSLQQEVPANNACETPRLASC